MISTVLLRMLSTVINSTETGENIQSIRSSTVFMGMVKAKYSHGLDTTTEIPIMSTSVLDQTTSFPGLIQRLFLAG